MKHKLVRALQLMGALALLGLLSTSPATAAPFEVKTEAATNVGAYRAQLNGSYLRQPTGEGVYGYEYGTTTEYGSEAGPVEFGPGSSKWISAPITVENLKPETTYHFRFGLADGFDYSWGKDMTFTTRSLPRFEAGEYFATVSAKQQASNPVVLSFEGVTLNCEDFGGTGTMLAATMNLKLTPTFSGCKAFGFINPTITTNGCQYQIQPGDSGAPTTTLALSCPEGKSLEVQASTCRVAIPGQSLGTLTATNKTATTPDSIDLSLNSSGITYTKFDGVFCPLKGSGTVSNGTLTGGQTLTAVNSSGVGTDMKIGY